MTEANACLRRAEDDGARSSGIMSADVCRTAADVWARAAHVRAFRTQVWPPQRPVAPRPVLTPAPAGPESPDPDLIALRCRLLALAPPASPGQISVRRVLEATAEHFGLPVADLLSHSTKRRLCRGRQLAMFVAYRVTGRGLPFIAFHIGGRDHTTIHHGVRAVLARIDAGDGETITAANQIIERLQTAGGAHG
jgi:hypothetical protein